MLVFVQILNFCMSQNLPVKRAKVFKALLIRLFNFVSNDAFVAAFKPKYTKCFKFFNTLAVDLYKVKYLFLDF